MELSNCFLFALIGFYAVIIVVHAQDQSGFISLDCGAPVDTNYSEAHTGIRYISDVNFMDNPEVEEGPLIESELRKNMQQQMGHVRSFPHGTRNCYRLNLARGDKYLIRANFMYGNYDNLESPPTFDLYLGPNLWRTVTIKSASEDLVIEIIYVLPSDYLYVCFVHKGLGRPFISALDLRLLTNTTYKTQSGSLQLLRRFKMAPEPDFIRYKDDIYDRIWLPSFIPDDWSLINASDTIDSGPYYQPSPLAMETAGIPTYSRGCLSFSYEPTNSETQFYVYMHFAEVEELRTDETREMSISLNGKLWYGPFRPEFLKTTTVFTKVPLRGGQFNKYSICRTSNSTHPPIINAMEVYTVKKFLQSQTEQIEVDAITNIKSMYKLKRKDWQGDPCAPQDYMWHGLNCTYNGYDPPRIIFLNLSSSGLTGEVAPYLSNLAKLEYLDLSNNRLSGKVPEFLYQLTSLRLLNLSGNDLRGSVPLTLLKKSEDGSLLLSVDDNPDLCTSVSCMKRKSNYVVPLVASLASLLILITITAIFWMQKRIKQETGGQIDAKFNISSGSLESKDKQYKYAEILKITDNFKTLLGQGDFGEVFHGYLNDSTEVAVKMLSASSRQGYMQFLAEVKLLLTVHHKNLTTLFGYCDEGGRIGLIYEFMANGNLQYRLSDSNARVLNWEERLRIAAETGQGLEYLHDGCKPPRVHRDIKSANILLNDKLQAKIADFGLSRSFPIGGTHVSTVIAGTHGYLDPEHYLSDRLTEKSDVYSFGVVVLEIITSRPVITNINDDNRHISQWVNAMLSQGDIRNIVDSRLQGDYDINSAWKAVEVAMQCVSPAGAARPSMNHVVRELKECIAMEIARKEENGIENQLQSYATVSDIEMTPLAR